MSEDAAPLGRMLEALSVAVVGASVKEGSLGRQMLVELDRGGYEGAVYPVNPGYDEILGRTCYPSIAEVPEPVDLAILGVSNARIEQALTDAVAAGARSAVTFSSLYEEVPPSPDLPPLQDRLAAIAVAAGIPVCGGNGMGFIDLESNLRATGFATPDRMRRGPVTFISHSGSAFAALAFNDRGIGFNLLISSGNEIATTMADYMAYSLGLESTRVLALLLETVRDPQAFRDALARAAEQGIPVIALKVGRTESSKAMVVAHSGALAGEHGAYEALFDAHGVIEVETLDEMADTMELFSSPRRVTTGAGIASVHDSGGERAMFADLAHDLGVPFAQISDETTHAIQDVLDPGLVAANPLDAWGTGIDADRIFREGFLLLHDDADTAAMAFVVDLTRQGEPFDEGYLQIAKDVFGATTKPFCVLSNLASGVAQDEATLLRDANIPVLEGTASGLRALRHLLADGARRGRHVSERPAPVSDEVRDCWRARLEDGVELSEIDGLALLADYGLDTIEARPASSLEGAIDAAEAIGFPVALKTAVPGIQHKSDVDGVRLSIDDPTQLKATYDDLARRLGPEVVVAAMAPPGVEVALGIVRDPTFGSLVLVAAGGILVELLHDRRLVCPPIDEAGARDLIDRLKMRPLLDSVRGSPPADVSALARAISRLSVLASDLGDHLDAADVNPVIVSPEGCVAVDALFLPRAPAR
ncbi:MAG: acetate--CoA ligase family protein [Actinomycetota bacterium]|nr:acetate--CoA ligase family protein [Actinomycetota bacterium]